MLPIPELDDRRFEQIVNEAKQMIPMLFPAWTDENYHDPGITFIELFAWLTEMQQYYLNRITLKNELKFLKLLGFRRRAATLAKVQLFFENIGEAAVIPRGTPFLAEEEVFETDETVLLVPNGVSKIIVRTESELWDRSAANENLGVAYYAFGPDARTGSKWYIGFDSPLPEGRDLTLTVQMFEDYPVPIGGTAMQAQVNPSARLVWSYYGTDGAGEGNTEQTGWHPLDVSRDETQHLAYSGRLAFRLGGRLQPLKMYPAADRPRYWLCCTMAEGRYEVAPQVLKVCMNAVPATHRRTWVRTLEFDGTGKAGQTIGATDDLVWNGIVQVQVRRKDGGWIFWNEAEDLAQQGPSDRCYSVRRDEESKTTVIVFGDGRAGAIPPQGKNNIRIIAVDKSFAHRREPAASNGLPLQTVLTELEGIEADSFRLQVGEEQTQDGFSETVWFDWRRVDDLDRSGPDDPHYTLDSQAGEIGFGNHEQGRIPEKANFRNIAIVSCSTGGGEKGNIISRLPLKPLRYAPEWDGLALTNHFGAKGGADPETMEQTKQRVAAEFEESHSAVTGSDYEALVKRAPGLRIARVKALPLYKPGMHDYPNRRAPAQMTLVVVPYSEAEMPLPSAGFMEMVRRFLEPYRLITTELHVMEPVYIEITVQAAVVADQKAKEVDQAVRDALCGLLRPLDKNGGSGGWEFGKTVHKGDVLSVIHSIPGVHYVESLTLHAGGAGWIKERSGDIRIPPYALVYSGDHIVDVRCK
ncbi:putative baseplate assembly protein [Paenibacillus hamazuiensis]|uniref:putative baseplate assembly protein n=1 Tax=Paenibacillus hamazuiensis TaxID=2936508 RepID=UPI00200CBC91|nr:putative baseplate assembly protein [Paenibacillus hamazuiensis]